MISGEDPKKEPKKAKTTFLPINTTEYIKAQTESTIPCIT